MFFYAWLSSIFTFLSGRNWEVCGANGEEMKGWHARFRSSTNVPATSKAPVSTDLPIVVIGDKSKAQLSRVLSSNLAIMFN